MPKRDQGLLSLLAHQLIMPNPSHPPNPIMLALMSERSAHLAPHIKSNTPKIPFDHLTLCILVTLWLAPSVWYHLDFSSHQALQLSTPNQSRQAKTTTQRSDLASKVEQVTKIERSTPSIFKRKLNRQKPTTRVNQQDNTHKIDQRQHDRSTPITSPSKALEDMKSKSRRTLGQIGGMKSGGVDGYQSSQNRRYALELAKSLPRKSVNVPKTSIRSNVVRDPRQQALKFGLRRTLMLNDYPPVLRKLIVHTQSVSQESNTTLSPKQ